MTTLQIDGAMGEGGGQVLRSALSLSLLTGQPFRLSRIRANRDRRGLRPQHLAALQAAARVAGAEVRGDRVGSEEIEFAPGFVRPGDYFFDIGTAGATSLVLQTLLLPLALARDTSSVTIRGGTHVPWSPCFHYLDWQWRPFLTRFGIPFDLTMTMAGFYPQGGGELQAQIPGGARPRPLKLTKRGPVRSIRGLSAVGNLPREIAERQLRQALRRLHRLLPEVEPEVIVEELPAASRGTVLLLLAEYDLGQACCFALGARGKRAERVAENALLRQQVIVLRRGIRRPRVHRHDRLHLLILVRLCRRWRDALHVVNPETLLRWHRDLFKIVWRRRSRPRYQPMRLAPEVVTLIQTMAKDNALRGAERIRGELLKLGIRVSKRTIQKYMRHVRPSGSRGQTWSTFIRNHSGDIWACDFLQLYDVFFRPIFAFFFVVHGTREVVHVNATRCPTDAWAAQQLREATPYCSGPSYLIRDNDEKFGKRFAAVAEGTEIEVVKIPPRSPNLNPICERFLGSVRRECLDHVVILSERQLHRVLREYVEIYFNRARPHQGLFQRIPARAASRSVSEVGRNVVGLPILGGLHHDYQRAA